MKPSATRRATYRSREVLRAQTSSLPGSTTGFARGSQAHFDRRDTLRSGYIRCQGEGASPSRSGVVPATSLLAVSRGVLQAAELSKRRTARARRGAERTSAIVSSSPRVPSLTTAYLCGRVVSRPSVVLCWGRGVRGAHAYLGPRPLLAIGPAT